MAEGKPNLKANRELILKLYREGLSGAPKDLARYFSSQCVDHAFGGIATMQSIMARVEYSYPGCTWRVDDLAAERDRVAVRATLVIPRIPSPSRKVRTFSFYKIANGEIIEMWAHGDSFF